MIKYVKDLIHRKSYSIFQTDDCPEYKLWNDNDGMLFLDMYVVWLSHELFCEHTTAAILVSFWDKFPAETRDIMYTSLLKYPVACRRVYENIPSLTKKQEAQLLKNGCDNKKLLSETIQHKKNIGHKK